jgi:transcriptional regulator of acetoin/glycerol metabolism
VKEQNNNRRDNRILTYRGKTQTAAQWSDELGIIRSTLYERIRRGSPIEVILKEAV